MCVYVYVYEYGYKEYVCVGSYRALFLDVLLPPLAVPRLVPLPREDCRPGSAYALRRDEEVDN